MLLLLASFFGLLTSTSVAQWFHVEIPTTTSNPGPLRVRSLSGTQATNGDPLTNQLVLELITVGLLGGFAIRKVKMFNDRVYLEKFRRSFWLGTRYFQLDNFYYLATRDTCLYQMNATERRGLEYEDGIPITEIVYQCERYVEYCCGLVCCRNSQSVIARGIPDGNHPPFFSSTKATRIASVVSIFSLFLVALIVK